MRHSFVDGMDNHQIAKLLNISIHTVKNQKARAIYLIRKRLGGKALLMLSLLLLEMQSGRVADYEDQIAAQSCAGINYDYQDVHFDNYSNS
jgi:hypothetical protein